MTKDLRRIRWLIGLLILVSIVYACAGCGSFPLCRHVELVKESKLNLDLVADAIAKNITIEKVGIEKAQSIVDIYNEVAEAQHFYVDGVKAFRKGSLAYNQEDLDIMFEDLTVFATDLAAELMVYGVNIYKFVERIK